jgi:hypothetical protein
MTGRDKKRDRSLLRELRNEHRRVSREYGEAKERVREYTTRRYLSPGEELECKTLQRLKLNRKDELQRVQRQLEEAESHLGDALGSLA